ncbi:MAG: glycosyltransferase [Bacteroidales bacterium]|nr:glycosyltransferase [Bacteroidales bacterium]NLK81593.1 glycosyltransferase [Bacteroidales bacterium]
MSSSIVLSVVICSYNRANYIRKALESIKNQSYDYNAYELIVVNNNSTDNTEEICADFESKKGNLQYVYAVEKKQGLSCARNKGIQLAGGKYISFIDDDAIAKENYVEQIIWAFETYTNFEALGGKVLPIYPNNTEPLWMSKYLNGLVAKVDMGDAVSQFTNKYPVGCNMAFHKKIFDEIGMFNEELTFRNDDKYIFLQIKKAGKKILYIPTIVVHHNIDAERIQYKNLIKLCYAIGYSERVRLQHHSFIEKMIKGIEYTIKFFASYLLAIPFLLNKQSEKGRFLITVRKYILVSYIKPDLYKGVWWNS